jgi:hypothetical protein
MLYMIWKPALTVDPDHGRSTVQLYDCEMYLAPHFIALAMLNLALIVSC